MSVHRYTCVQSTMITARALADSGAPHGDVVVARQQTAGRGRHGRAWLSGAGAGLWLTCIWRPPRQRPLHELTLVAGVAVYQALAAWAPQAGLTLKWPNDVVHGSRKLAGILAEAEALHTAAPYVLVGVGINLQAATCLFLPPELRQRYVGLAELGCTATAESVLPTVCRALAAAYSLWHNQGLTPLRQIWHAADGLRGRWVRAEGLHGPIEGEACGIDAHGHLQLRTGAGMQSIMAGEVERLRPTNEPAAPHGV